MKQITTLFLIFTFLLQGVETVDLQNMRSASVATSEGLPSSIVNGVCVISGEYVEHNRDMSIQGIAPLNLNRGYASKDPNSSLSAGWYWGMPDAICLSEGNEASYAILIQPSGAKLGYKYKGKKEQGNQHFLIDLPDGLTNASGNMSGKTNLRNQTVIHDRQNKRFIVKTGDGTQKIFPFRKRRSGAPLTFVLSEEQQANGLKIKYFRNPKSRLLHEMWYTSKVDLGMSWLRFERKNIGKRQKKMRVKGSDGSWASFLFDGVVVNTKCPDPILGEIDAPEQIFCLTQVQSDQAPTTRYSYQLNVKQTGALLARKELPNGRYLENHYYHKKEMIRNAHLKDCGGIYTVAGSDDPHLDNIKTQREPVGSDASPITTFRFFYWNKRPYSTAGIIDLAEKKLKGFHREKEDFQPCTDVYNSHWNKTRYHYSRRKRLTSIVKYTGSMHYLPYSKEQFVWGKRDTPQEGNLLGKYLKDANGKIISGQFFKYDPSGNVEVKGICGNLTGRSDEAPFMGQDRYPERGEIETTQYGYSNDGINFLTWEAHSNGVVIHYLHSPGLDCLHGKITMVGSEVKHREFYDYDCHGALKEKIEDDGKFFERENLYCMTERRITRYATRNAAPFGVPDRKEEFCWNPVTGQEELLKRTHYTYDSKGKLIREEVYDAEGLFCFAKTWERDAHGNVIRETDPLGHVIVREYNIHNELIYSQGPRSDYSTHYSYDFCGRLIQEEERHADGSRFSASHRYNLLKQKIASCDLYGQETRYQYDEFGRCTQVHYPPIGTYQPVTHAAYDLLGNVTAFTDAEGHCTTASYTVRGQPTQIRYPDGSQERFFYRLDGLLEEKIEKNGSKRVYTYDYQNRLLTETLYSPEGERISCFENQYNTFHLTSTINEEGHQTLYGYDKAGRVCWVQSGDRLTDYRYDSLGRLSCTVESLPHGLARLKFKKYDWLDRVIEERTEDEKGTLFRQERYAYDAEGNKTLVDHAGSITLTTYNAHGNPIYICDALGHETRTSYDYNWINELGQRVLKCTSTDPQGYLNSEIFDASQHVAEKIRYNPFGLVVAHQKISYSIRGQTEKVEDLLIEGGVSTRTIETLYSYNAMQEISSLTEAAHTPEERITRYAYDPQGRLQTKVKPDGVSLHYTYDSGNRLKTLSSSDQSVSLSYLYNRKGELILAQDERTGATTKRRYNFAGELVEDSLSHGLALHYTYDTLGRVAQIDLPDGSAIGYLFSGENLAQVVRKKEGRILYTHDDCSYSLAGQPLSCKLPGNTGEMQLRYDALLRCISLDTNTFRDQIKRYDPAGNLVERSLQMEELSYAYDDLYQLKEEPGHTYTTNALGDRLLKDQIPHLYSATHQLIQAGSARYLSDPNGNMIERPEGSYRYDALDRLISATIGDQTVSYSYDPLHRRLSASCSGEELLFLYQGQEEIGAWKEGKLIQLKVLRTLSGNRAVAIELEGTPYLALPDLLGNVACLQTLEGCTVAAYRYTAFGEISSSCDEELPFNPWSYSNKRFDSVTGLFYFGARDYDPSLGRWISPDPALFEDGPNRYAYSRGNPLTFCDRFGLSSALQSKQWSTPQYVNLEDRFAPNMDAHALQSSWDLDGYSLFDGAYFEKTNTYSLNQMTNPETGSLFNYPQQPDKLILFSNGIQNDYASFSESLQHIGKFAQHDVVGVHSPCFGPLIDLSKACVGLFSEACFENVEQLHHLLNDYFKKNATGSPLLIGHSRGCIENHNCLRTFDPELRKRILVLSIAPGGYIDPDLCRDVKNYASTRDIVPRLDRRGLSKYRHTVEFLSPHRDAPLLDHPFTSPTYYDPIEKRVSNYLQHGRL